MHAKMCVCDNISLILCAVDHSPGSKDKRLMYACVQFECARMCQRETCKEFKSFHGID
jgi:hypothetical protein